MLKDKEGRDLTGNQVKEGRLCYDDYAALDDGLRYELADGVLELMRPGPSAVHQFNLVHLLDVLRDSCASEFLFLSSPIDVILSEYEVRQPDIVAIRRDRAHIITRRGIDGPPDLVVEIVSPTSAKRDRQDKFQVYAQYNIPEYWIVTAELSTLEQYVLDEGKYGVVPMVYAGEDIVQSRVLECARFTMADVISRLPELPNF